jgi:hypothetical protein
MNFSFYFIFAFCLLGFCSKSQSDLYVYLADQVIEYQLEGGQYAVIVVMDGISPLEAKKMARQRAAEITVQQGGRYFVIDSEQDTQVIKSDEEMDHHRFYGNMYQELIIENDFDRDRLRYQGLPATNLYSAYRLVFTFYKIKPSFKAIDACSIIKCVNNF